MDTSLVDTGIFVLENPETGELVQVVTCTRAAESLTIHPRTLKRAVARGTVPGGRTDGRWWIHPDALVTLTEAGWASLGLKPGPNPKKRAGPIPCP